CGVNDFHRDNDWQRRGRNEILVPYYRKAALEGRYVHIDRGRLATVLQKQFAVDSIIQGTNGTAFFIEEKFVRWPGYQYKCLPWKRKAAPFPAANRMAGWSTARLTICSTVSSLQTAISMLGLSTSQNCKRGFGRSKIPSPSFRWKEPSTAQPAA